MNILPSQFAPRLRHILLPAVCLLVCPPALLAQHARQKLTVPVTIPMDVELVHHVPMKAGVPITARLLFPVYVDNKLAVPAGSTLKGSVVALRPNRKLRTQARFYADFTPYDTPIVSFRKLVLPSGHAYPISTSRASGETPILHLTASAPHGKKAFLKAEFDQAKKRAEAEAALVTKPGRLDRLRRFIYHQLPYHPQRVDKGTAWTVHFSRPVTLPVAQVPPAPSKASTAGQAADPPSRSQKPSPASAASQVNQPSVQSSANHAWLLDAYLLSTISSATAKPGQHFRAYVARPVYGPHHKLKVPEGSILIGTITRARPAHFFGRNGKLRFTFNELRVPAGVRKPVEGTLAAADASLPSGMRVKPIRIDAEGGVAPGKRPGKILLPLAFSLLAVHGLDSDGSQAESGAMASNGFGLIGRIAGIAGGSRELATGIGSYAAAQSFYNHWLTRGQNVTFPKNTRIEVVTAPAPHRMKVPSAKSAPHTH